MHIYIIKSNLLFIIDINFCWKFSVDFKKDEQRRTKVRRSSYSLKDSPKLRQKNYIIPTR